MDSEVKEYVDQQDGKIVIQLKLLSHTMLEGHALIKGTQLTLLEKVLDVEAKVDFTRNEMKAGFDKMDARFDKLEERFDNLEKLIGSKLK